LRNPENQSIQSEPKSGKQILRGKGKLPKCLVRPFERRTLVGVIKTWREPKRFDLYIGVTSRGKASPKKMVNKKSKQSNLLSLAGGEERGNDEEV